MSILGRLRSARNTVMAVAAISLWGLATPALAGPSPVGLSSGAILPPAEVAPTATGGVYEAATTGRIISFGGEHPAPPGPRTTGGPRTGGPGTTSSTPGAAAPKKVGGVRPELGGDPGPGTVLIEQAGFAPELIATWAYPSSVPSGSMSAALGLFQASGSALTRVAIAGCVQGCTAYTFFGLAPGATYEVRVNPVYRGNWLPTMISPQVHLVSTCSAGACVEVDATRPVGPADQAGQGLLHSAYLGADQAFLPALHVSMHRGIAPYGAGGALDWQEWSAGNPLGWANTLVISDAWWDANAGAPPVPTADELPAYRQWLTTYLSKVLASGQRIDYFEPYNEPDLHYYSAAIAPAVTATEMYQLFLTTYQVIKNLDPSAQVIGPSMGEFEEWPVSGFEAGMDLPDFLGFASTNGIRLAAVTFHEISVSEPQKLVDDVAEARRLVARYPAVGQPKVFVNEYGDEPTQRTPGWDVSWLSSITRSGVNLAGRTCFADDCFQPDLDGLLTSDGSQTLPDYWVRTFYGSMAGQMVSTSSTDDAVQAVASYDGSSRVDVMVGRGVGCTDTARCGTMPGPSAAEPVMTTVRLPWTFGVVKVVATDISGAVIGPYGRPIPADSYTVPVPADGSIALRVPAFADGDAWTWTITKS